MNDLPAIAARGNEGTLHVLLSPSAILDINEEFDTAEAAYAEIVAVESPSPESWNSENGLNNEGATSVSRMAGAFLLCSCFNRML